MHLTRSRCMPPPPAPAGGPPGLCQASFPRVRLLPNVRFFHIQKILLDWSLEPCLLSRPPCVDVTRGSKRACENRHDKVTRERALSESEASCHKFKHPQNKIKSPNLKKKSLTPVQPVT